jgi:primosomal protein N'
VNLVLTGEYERGVIEATALVAALVEQEVPDAIVLGPVNCALERVMGKWRRHVLVKIPAYTSAAPIGRALKPFDVEGIQLTVDVDPYSMM